jgi:methionyl-tRNA synthetase
MSKSRGTFINAKRFAQHLNPEQMRYYLATKLGAGIDDLDLNFDDYRQRINSDLVGKVVNIASRCAGFIHKHHNSQLATTPDQPELLEQMLSQQTTIFDHYNQREYQRAVRAIMALADQVNQYIDQQKPWVLAKDPNNLDQVQTICSTGINAFRILAGLLKPILPNMTQASETFLQCDPIQCTNLKSLLLDHTIGPFKPLMQRVDPAQIEALLNETTS